MAMKHTKSAKDLLAENEDLRLRLEEALDTLRAIRSGEVDALVVSTPQGDQVYTLKGARTYLQVNPRNVERRGSDRSRGWHDHL